MDSGGLPQAGWPREHFQVMRAGDSRSQMVPGLITCHNTVDHSGKFYTTESRVFLLIGIQPEKSRILGNKTPSLSKSVTTHTGSA
jgi:hypothetical protein